jgi:hypothetical protein
MDDTLLGSLVTALEASPDNAALRVIVIRACAERSDVERAAGLIGDRAPDAFAEADRPALAEILVRAGRAERALAFAGGGSAEALMARVRAHLALEQREAARAAYREAVARNPTLEDMELKNRLAASVTEHKPEGGPWLRVIANDDTDDSESIACSTRSRRR